MFTPAGNPARCTGISAFRRLTPCARVINSCFGGTHLGGQTALQILQSRHRYSWRLFQAEWLKTAKGSLKVDPASGSVVTYADRTPAGEFRPSRLSVFATVELLLGAHVPNRLLHDWYRADLRRSSRLADTIECTDFAREWLAHFNRLKVDACSRQDLLQLLGGHPDWAAGLVEGLEYLAIIGYNSNPQRPYRLTMNANEAFVLANLLGNSAGNAGIDALVYGALRVPEDQLGIVIAGSGGMGKTTLALTVGAQCCARGGFCQVYRTEVSELAIRRTLHKFNSSVLPMFDVESWVPEDASATESAIPRSRAVRDPETPARRGLMRISRVSTGDLEYLNEAVLRAGEMPPEARETRYPELMVILDSISSMRGYGETSSESRSVFFENINLLRSRGFTVVVVVERDDFSGIDFETYVADLVIRLDRHKSVDPSSYFRTVEMLKSRGQVVHRGVHRYTIRDGIGLDISLSSAAVLHSLGNRGKQYYTQRSPIAVPIRGVATYLGGVSQAPGLDDRTIKTPFWKSSSMTLCLGRRSSLHDAFARQFLDGIDPQRPSALLIGFSEPARPDLHLLERRSRSEFPLGLRYDIDRGPVGKDGRRPQFIYLGFRGGAGLTPEDVLGAVRSVLQDFRRQQIGVGRAVVSDLATLPNTYPTLGQDPSFVEAMFESFASENVTTAAVLSETEASSEAETASLAAALRDRLEALADNVVRFDSVGAPGRQRQSIRVERSSDNSHDKGVYEIRRRSHEQLEVSPSFDLLQDPFSQEPKDASIHLFLHYETSAQQQYHNRCKQREESFGTMQVHVADHTVPSYAINLARRVLGSPGLFIVQVDNRQLPLRYQEGERPLLADLDRYPQINELAKQLVAAPVKGSSPRKRQHVPYYLNPPVLTVAPELFEYLQRTHPEIAKGEGNYTWIDVADAVHGFADQKGLHDVPIMGNPAGADSLNCLFLEILASTWPAFWQHPHMSEWFLSISPARQSAESAALMLHSLLHPYRPTDADEQPLLRREWYSFHRNAPSGRQAILLPGGVCACGDWYLGIVDGSIAVRTGVRLILDQFVNPAAGMDLMEQGVGLTPFRRFYNTLSGEVMPGLPLSRFASYVSGRGVIYRSLLWDYAKIDPLLHLELADMLQFDAPTTESLESQVKGRFDFLGEMLATRS